MLWEIWQYLTTPCPRHQRKMGYLREFIGIASRHGRLQEAWRSHLEETRRFILESAERCAQRRHAVVLGSGWLLDVPWRELAARFARLSLVDLIHPRAVRRQVRAFPQVELVTADLTGLTSALFERRAPGPLPVPTILNLDRLEPVDYLVSVNVLSQLPLIPLEFLKKTERASDPDLENFARSILQRHLELLQGRGCPACLVTDVESLTCDRAGTVTEREDLLHGWSLPPPQREWVWRLAPEGEIDAGHRTEHRVVAISL